MSVDYSAAPCLPWSSSGYFTKFLFQIRPVFRVQEGIRLADYLTSLCLSLRTLGTVWVSLKTFSGFRWEISHSFRDTELTQTHSIQKLCIIAELRFVRTLKCVFGWRGVDSGYLHQGKHISMLRVHMFAVWGPGSCVLWPLSLSWFLRGLSRW